MSAAKASREALTMTEREARKRRRANAAYERQRRAEGPRRGRALSIDSGSREVAAAAPASVRRIA